MGSEEETTAMTITIQHLGKKEAASFPADTTLRQFQTDVERRTGVPVGAQKVVHRGRDLARNDPDVTLDSCRVKNKDIIMILGRPLEPVQDEAVAAIRELETRAEHFASRLDTIQKDIDDMQKGFLPAAMCDASRPRLERRLASVSEELMRLLERLDSIGVTSEGVRRKRKAVVTDVNSLMDRAEAIRAALTALAT